MPGIRFNPNKQKSTPNTKYDILEIKEQGKTNYDNIAWSDRYLIIKTQDKTTYNSMYVDEINGKKYLEILMMDSMTITSNERPISYIYEQIKIH